MYRAAKSQTPTVIAARKQASLAEESSLPLDKRQVQNGKRLTGLQSWWLYVNGCRLYLFLVGDSLGKRQ